MQALPTGIQSFEKLRKENYLYVDKTRQILRLIERGSVLFLSRPRRFGKSLLVSTLQALFEGRKDLFEGLYIADKVDWEQRHPVIKLDLSLFSGLSAAEMNRELFLYQEGIADDYGITLKRERAANRMEELLKALHEKTGTQVVVLIDEYDMPIQDALNKPVEKIDEIREFLQTFYKAFKTADEHIRFLFMTGITKFAKVSVFSALNNLVDVTLNPAYATLCGYTQEELESRFAPHLEELAAAHNCDVPEALAKIRRWYNGFSWDGKNLVYNPFSTLALFEQQTFTNLWFETGTPTFIVNIIKERNDVQLLLESSQMKQSDFNSFDYRTLNTQLLLFQSGYLTIKKAEKDEFGDELIFTLGVPNYEVRQSLMDYLTCSFTGFPVGNTGSMRSRMMEALLKGEAAAFEANLKELFANIPYQLHIKREAYYHSLLLLWLNMLGFHVEAEVSTDKGRIDAVWTWKERAVIVEVKYASKGALKALLDMAMDQIKEKGYCERYAATHERVAQLAVAFSGKRIGCRMKELLPNQKK
jgi:Holliday junction resolvase-like predicted endonuclease